MEQKVMPFRGGKVIPVAFIAGSIATIAESPSRSLRLVRIGTAYLREGVVEEKSKDYYIICNTTGESFQVQSVPELISLTIPANDNIPTNDRYLPERLIALAAAESLLQRSDVFLESTLTTSHPLELQALARLQVAGVKMLRSCFGISPLSTMQDFPGSGIRREQSVGGVLVHTLKFTHGVSPLRLDALRPPSDDLLATLDRMTSRDSIPNGLKKARSQAAFAPGEEGILKAEILLSLGIGPDDIGRVKDEDLKALLQKKVTKRFF